ncbi:GH36-type glycosyl hydrolase domain-containing protein [Dokdonella soli]|uniref:Glucoamylase family protein n=1 Tax=Dokdonella soli TaxID=529810 RepID=A0ABN1IIR8_9GAMM
MSPLMRRWFESWPVWFGQIRAIDDIAGEGDAPLRAELLSAEQMEEHGRALGAEHRVFTGKRSNSLLLRLSENETVLRDSCALLADAIKTGHRVTPAGEWLLDNLYLIDEQIRTARRHFPERYSWELPRLQRGASAGLPRVYDIALNSISHGDGRVDQDTLSRFVHAYQEAQPLALGELWAIPIMLRLALIENLRRVAFRVRSDRRYRNLAARWADEMIDIVEQDPKSLILIVSDMARSQPPMRGAFVAELSRRLQGHSAALALPLTWVEQRLQEAGMTIEQLVHATNQEEAADQVSISNSIGSLRLLEAIDWREFVEGASGVERVLRDDPAGVYSRMDFATRDSYRHVVEKLSRESGKAETDVAECAIMLAREASPADAAALDRHVGYYLIDAGVAALEHCCGLHRRFPRLRACTVPFPLYFGALLLTGALIAVPALLELWRTPSPTWLIVATAVCTIVALSQLAVALVNRLASLALAPRPLPRMECREGVPPEAQTLVVVPTLLGSEEDATELVEELEIRFLANRDPNIRFALLTDFGDWHEAEKPSDEKILAIASTGIANLNARHTESGKDPFYLLHRPRRWSESERSWIGFERKRGKLGELNALLRNGAYDRYSHIVGDLAQLRATRYVITLDSDTQLPRDAAHQLVATMEHPLNRPRFDEVRRRVVAGYGILQPRIGTSFTTGRTTRYAMLFGGDPGVDPYTRAVSDTYQDLFGEGSFTGKGIYDVDAFEHALAERVPLNRILSHDLLEGCYVRSGLATDIELYERYPQAYRLDARRRERWIRGDWQIAEWLFSRVPVANGSRESNPLSGLSLWKIFDNLRRSLVAPALCALLLLAWTALARPLWWTLLITGILLLPMMIDTLLSVVRKPPDLKPGRHLTLSLHDAGRRFAQFLFEIACLPHQTWLSLDAIVRTGWRVHVSRRRLLQWVASRTLESGAHRSSSAQEEWIAPLAALAIATYLLRIRPEVLPMALPWLLLWLAAPLLERWLARAPRDESEVLDATQVPFIRGVARRTWAFFERFVDADNHWLPPDNYQEQPITKIAQRTSPTNIGLCLLANLTAWDLGYLSLVKLLERTALTFDTLHRLERYRGHFYNWYDTVTLQPLHPHYVSTVDSGNLAGHLLTLRQGLLELAHAPVIHPRLFAGLADTFGLLRDGWPKVDAAQLAELDIAFAAIERDPPRTVASIRAQLLKLIPLAEGVASTRSATQSDAVVAHAQTLARECRAALDDTEAWLIESASGADGNSAHSAEPDSLPTLTSLDHLAPADSEPATSPASLRGVARARACLQEIERLASACDELARAGYRFLYDEKRHLFAIGYNVSEAQRDTGYYDLLASEVRLGVFAAVAHGQVPQESWFALGRLLTAHEGPPTLLSWSGSMFEYLMPLLVMPAYPGSLLAQTCRAAIARQIVYARQRDVPWGISESGYNLTDAAQNYQYRAFGVPGLGLQRGLSQELVVAPYASALALTTLPHAAADNLRAMAAKGWLTGYGFYEAVDYTPTRQQPGETHTIVRSFMAHHQGMSLLACAHALLDRPLQRRFENYPQFQATLLLLQERVPRTSGAWASDPEVVDVRSATEQPQMPLRVFRKADTRRPAMQLLSNGRYHVMVTAAGGGYSRWRDLALTRWREDVTRDAWGMYAYLRDCDSGRIWSTTFHPTLATVDSYEAVFTESRVEFRCRAGQFDAHTDIVVSPEDDIELRRTRITNRSRVERTIEFTSYAEIVLAPAASDDAHPAFSNLFVQTEFVKTRDAILCTRRPRSSHEAQPWMFHLVAVHDAPSEEISHESDRMRFIGRGRSSAAPRAMLEAGPLSGTAGSVLDPIAAVRHRFKIRPEQTICIDMVTGAAEGRDECLWLADKYHDRHLADRVLDLAWTHSRVVLGQINVSETDAQTYARLAECLVYVDPVRRAAPGVIASNRRGQSGLWAFAISGDLPIVLLQIGASANIDLVRQLVHAHAYCRLKGLVFDLLIWNAEHGGYRQILHDEILGVIAGSADASLVDKPGGIFVRALEQISHEDRVLMQSVARVVLSDEAGSLIEQLRAREATENVPRFTATRTREAAPAQNIALPPRTLVNGIGGFSRDSREYVIATDSMQRTPQPWINVIANPDFGCIVSESGSGCTWFENAHEYRLTPWSDDPVCDPNTEAFYIRDEETGHHWSPTPLPAPGAARYVSRHGFGYSAFETIEDGIVSELRIHVDPEAPVKFFVLRLRNDSGRARRLSATGYVEWVLGDLAAKTAMHVVTEIDASGALLARNAYNAEFADRVAFFDVDDAQRTLTGDRSEFIGRNGNMRQPAAMGRVSLSGRVGARLDPCGAIQIPLELADSESRTLIFRLGAGRDQTEATATVRRFRRSGSARNSFEASNARWAQLLGAVVVDTPDHALNALANGWLLYQVISCRLWGRSGFYQSGGAFGFRDQLQDAMALVHAAPHLLRAQIVLCASRQFREGDVQHWWHPPGGRGVRTRCSDDYLWLPLATGRYLRASGDWNVLDEQANFLDGRALNPGEESYYDMPLRSNESADLYQHCARAIEHGLRLGVHGLPLMGSGDWNDGMNNVGHEGRGESVWLGFFLYRVLVDFTDIAAHRGDTAFVMRCRDAAQALKDAIDRHAWDGEWYLRAYFDDGTPLGTAKGDECRIDSIAQSWSVLSGAGDPQRAGLALDALDRHLVKPEAKLIELLEPPFDKSSLDPGYIRGYVPGVRENGGQYTHAAVWAVMAFAEAGRTERAWELFDLINPVRHGTSPAAIATWMVEPYVAAADVLAVPPHTGRGGWTWYTGSAGWMYRLIVESLLGIHREADMLILAPRLPAAWPALSITYRFETTTYAIEIRRDTEVAGMHVTVDGSAHAGTRIALIDDGAAHRIELLLGS